MFARWPRLGKLCLTVISHNSMTVNNISPLPAVGYPSPICKGCRYQTLDHQQADMQKKVWNLLPFSDDDCKSTILNKEASHALLNFSKTVSSTCHGFEIRDCLCFVHCRKRRWKGQKATSSEFRESLIIFLFRRSFYFKESPASNMCMSLCRMLQQRQFPTSKQDLPPLTVPSLSGPTC